MKTNIYNDYSNIQSTFDMLTDLCLKIDPNGIILDYESEPETHLPRESIVGLHVCTFFPTYVAEKIQETLRLQKYTRKPYTFEYSVSTHSIVKRYEARFYFFSHSERIAVIHDITSRVLNQKSLSETEKLLLEIQKIAKIFTFVWDIKENRVIWTEEFFQMIRKKPDEVENTPDGFLKFVHPEDREIVIREIESSLRYRTNLYVEYRFILPGDKVAHFMSHGKLIFDEQNNPAKMIGLNQDITEQKESQLLLVSRKQELEHLLQNIEKIVSQKTAELVLAKENAERANQAKTLFIANISHELKTPIHAIMSFAELGKEKSIHPGQEKIQEYFSIIYESGNRLFRLMSNMLDLSKLDSGNETYDFTLGDILELTENTIRELQGLMKQKNLEIAIENNTDETKLIFDYSKITQVVRNLLSNAIKFSPENSRIQIELNSGNYAFKNGKPEPSLLWKIIDSGSGIDEDEKELIFKKFEQGKKVKAGTMGTGLGLAICKEIIAGHRGVIYAENNAKQGTEFVFLIPRNQDL